MPAPRWHGSRSPAPQRLLGGMQDRPRSESPEARSPVCYEVLDKGGSSMVICDPGSLPPRKGEKFCWTFNDDAVCAFHQDVPRFFTELGGIYTCECPAFTKCTDPAGTFQPEPGWPGHAAELTLGRCEAASGALFGITLFFGIMIAAGCFCFCRSQSRKNAKVNVVPGVPGVEGAYAIGSR